MKRGSKAALVCCSNGRPRTPEEMEKQKRLKHVLTEIGLIPVFSELIFEKESGIPFSGTGRERANCLMNCYRDPEIQLIFDLSGGDLANEVLPYLDFDIIAKSEKPFWGYSDLTCVINAIYEKTGKASVLYQIRNLIGKDSENQTARFSNSIFGDGKKLYSFQFEFIQRESMQGIVVGGNIRCLLKLAGTPYWPDMQQKILLLEGFHGGVAQMTAYLSQLKQMGVFEKISGILLGTFTEMEEKGYVPTVDALVKQYARNRIPIAKTSEIGHGADAKAIVIGEEICLSKRHRMICG